MSLHDERMHELGQKYAELQKDCHSHHRPGGLEMSDQPDNPAGFANTDRELWRERPDDYYADSIHVTAQGGIGINCGGHVFVKPLREWHRLASSAEIESLGKDAATALVDKLWSMAPDSAKSDPPPADAATATCKVCRKRVLVMGLHDPIVNTSGEITGVCPACREPPAALESLNEMHRRATSAERQLALAQSKITDLEQWLADKQTILDALKRERDDWESQVDEQMEERRKDMEAILLAYETMPQGTQTELLAISALKARLEAK